MARVMGWFGSVLGVVISCYPILFLVVRPTYRPEEILPQYLLGWALILATTLWLHFQTRWSTNGISRASILLLVLTSMCFLLGGYTTLTPAEAAAASGAQLPGGRDEGDVYNDESPGPFIMGLALVSLAGAGAYPMFPRFSFYLYSIPVFWIVANLGWEQPQKQFVAIALLQTLLLIQVGRRKRAPIRPFSSPNWGDAAAGAVRRNRPSVVATGWL